MKRRNKSKSKLKAPRRKPLPKEVYVYSAYPNDSEATYFSMEESLPSVESMDVETYGKSPVAFGRYVLVEELTVSKTVITTIVKKHKK